MNINEIMSELAEYNRIIDDATAAADALKDKIKAIIAESGKDTIIGIEHKASYKDVTSSRLDSKALKAAYPEIVSAFTVSTVTKRFTFN